MKKSQFKTPLIQSAAVLGGVIVLFAVVASSGSSGSGGGFVAMLSGIGSLILFGIGMAIALFVSITLLIAIFLAAVAMVDSSQASQMYSDLKKNFALKALALSGQYTEGNTSEIGIAEEEYNRMKEEIAQLQENNGILQGDLKGLTAKNEVLLGNVDGLKGENSNLKDKIEELTLTVEGLQSAEQEIKGLVEELTKKIEAGADQDLKDQIGKLENLQADTRKEIDTLVGHLSNLETGLKQCPTFGIFSYIGQDDQAVFIKTVEDAVAKDMTYAQIHEYLSQNLTPELDKIIKDHPSLSKTYIRNLRKD